jgi:HlyD family secretion protein
LAELFVFQLVLTITETMAKSKKGRKIIVFTVIGLILIGLTAGALFKRHEAEITVSTELVARRTITEIVVANGKIQPVMQVKISPEVSGEIIDLPIKEGQAVKKGDLLLKIKPDFYVASRNQAKAGYESSLAGKATAEANLRKAQAEFKRSQELYHGKFISASVFDEAQANFDVAQAQLTSSDHQVEMAKANLESAEDQLSKTTIVSPLSGSVSKLNSRLGERVLGTVQNVGTEVMTIADLNEMEAQVDIGEIDVVLIAPGQKARLEVDAFKDKKFAGTVSEIANSSRNSGGGQAGMGSANNSQEATKFEVRIRITDKEAFRPGMSVTAEIETRSRTNVLAVPIASVTTRLPKDKSDGTNHLRQAANANNGKTETNRTITASSGSGTNTLKGKEASKQIEVVFLNNQGRARMVPVKIGISDDSWWEITDGLKENDEVISGGYHAISSDLEDGKKIRKEAAHPEVAKDTP